MQTFGERLSRASDSNQSLLCVGLDPDPSLMPIADIFEFNRGIIDATKDLVCAYKPNLAFYDSFGEKGHKSLKRTLAHLRDVAPEIPVIADAKRGDVQSTSIFHAKAMFQVWGFDAVTVNPYGGRDSVEPFLSYEDKGILIWCRSSNPGAGEIQDLRVVTEEGEQQPRPLYEWIAQRAREWNDAGNVGVVVGAPYPGELKRVRELCPDMPILIPGVGAQRGPLELAVHNGVDRFARNAIINVSRGIIYASNNAKDFDKAARDVALDVREHIKGLVGFLGKPWSDLAPSPR